MRNPIQKVDLGCLAAALLLATAFTARCPAQAGTLDPTFGDGGKVTTDFPTPGSYDAASSVVTAIQGDGKIVVAGTSDQGTTRWDLTLARYNTDGSLDTSFGSGGKVTTDFAGRNDAANAIAIQADGKIVAAGYSYQLNAAGKWYPDFALARYNTNGSLDASFGSSGKVTTDFGTSYNDWAYGVAIQNDGKIVAVGSSTGMGLREDFSLARYNSDGSLDTSFGSGGKVTTDFDYGDDNAYAIAIQGDGKIVAAGASYHFATPSHFALTRYNSDGSLDASFGSGGKVTTDFGTSYHDWAYGVAIQGDGKLVVSGHSYQGTAYPDFALARYNSNGSPDLTFGSSGKVTTDFGYRSDGASAVMIQGDGRIVAAGTSTQGPVVTADFALARYNTDGSLDATFGTDGKVTTDFGVPSPDAAGDIVALQGDGRTVAAGYSYQGTTSVDFALARYNSDGSLDTTFGSGGKATTDFDSSDDHAYTVAIQGDGKIVAAGYSDQGTTGYDFALARYNSDGSLDASFGSGGKVTTHFGYSHDYAYTVAIQADGKIVAAGYSDQGTTTYDFALARYNTDGSLDTSFGAGGKVTTHFGYSRDYAYTVAIQADGKIVAAGYSDQGTTTYDFALARYNSDGSLDTSFGAGGKVTTPFGYSHDYAYAVAIEADGRILAAGYSFRGGTNGYDFALARYKSDGSLDSTFGSGGLVTTDFGSYHDTAYAIALQADGRILAAGHSNQGTTLNDFALARYNSDGSLDVTFGSGGRVTTDFEAGNDRAQAMALLAGKIMLGGYARTSNRTDDFALARYVGYTDPLEVLEQLAQQVEDLAAAAVLNNGQARSLETKIEAAIFQIDRGDNAAACNQLQAFMDEVNALVAGNVLTLEQGQALYDWAASIKSELS